LREFGEKRIEKKTREKKRKKKSSRNKITERKLGEKETRKLTIYIYIYIKQSPFSNPKSTTEIATNFHPPS
jgi:hypothetical protein